MKTTFALFLSALCLCLSTSCSEQGVVAETIPDYPISLGVSAPFSGVIGNRILVAGGCNFPDTPAADGGQKKFYSEAFTLHLGETPEWEKAECLPSPLAYGMSVAVGDTLVFIGGQNAEGAVSSACLYTMGEQGVWGRHALPSLPVCVESGGAAAIGRRIYVCGGNQEGGDNSLYVLNLDCPDHWEVLPGFPGQKRQQPVFLSAGDRLYLFGGFDREDSTGRCLLATEILSYSPEKKSWEVAGLLPEDEEGHPLYTVGAAGVSAGNRLVLTGGVNAGIFTSAVEGRAPEDYMRRPADWYRFSHTVGVFSPENGQWVLREGPASLARAGASVLYDGHDFYLICGEEKPGIRSAQVTRFHVGENGEWHN